MQETQVWSLGWEEPLEIRNGAAAKSPDFVFIGSFGLPLEENRR